jgi:hypothetical protein
MVAIKGHFDGRVIFPDEPVNLPANQRLIVHLQPVPTQQTDFRTWLGLGKRVATNPSPQFNSDADFSD